MLNPIINLYPSGGGNIFINSIASVAEDVSAYLKKLANIETETAGKKVELIAKNKKEKIQKQLEIVNKLPESKSKQTILKAVREGKIMALFSDPSSENKPKNTKYNKDEYEKEVAKIIPDLIELERRCT